VTEKSDTSLVDSSLNGDADAFNELCKRYYSAMVAIGHSILGDRQLAEDAAQQAFAKVVEKLPQLKRKNQFANWLSAICRNVARDIARSTKLFYSDDIATLTTAVEPHNDSEGEAVKEALGKLSASAREVIFLRYYDGMSYEQISAVLGISEQAINGRLRRAKKKLANHLRHKGLDRCNYE
jgi:RNA polymerase sigma-70 factor (ECF subfamily)